MELHQLRYFVEVAKLLSFTRAAGKCHVSQPSLSQQIIKLERELGQPLFERLGRNVRMTDAGLALYARAESILASVDEIRDRVKASADPHRGRVNVGAIPTVAPYLLPPLLRDFSKRYPLATVALDENLTDLVVRGCLEGNLDVGVIASSVANDLLRSEILLTEELLLALPPKHAFVTKRSISWDDLTGEPFVLMSELHCLGEQVDRFCKQQDCLPAISGQSVQLLTIQELVALGHGVSLIPAMARRMDRGRRCEYRSLAAPAPTRTIQMAWHKDRYQSPIVKEFIQALRSVATF